MVVSVVSSQELRVRLLLFGYRKIVRPMLFSAFAGDPEAVHDQMIHLMAKLPDTVLHRVSQLLGKPSHPITIAGIDFPGRVGVAAGLDKNGLAAKTWGSLGFGFAELGTVTAKAQPGNRPPRLFRLPHSRAIINRMGFNNFGAEAMAAQLLQSGAARGTNSLGIPIGISIGKTKTTPLAQAVDDYLFSLEAVSPYADYVAVNVSSPNTPGLRGLQDHELLTELLTALVERSAQLNERPIPLFVKIAPDLTQLQIDQVLQVAQECGISGIIATNTTIERRLLHPSERYLANQAGGLSGAPLTNMSLQVVKYIASQTNLPIIGSGGVMTPAHAQQLFDAGAKLVQVYTGFIFNGPALITGINSLTSPIQR